MEVKDMGIRSIQELADIRLSYRFLQPVKDIDEARVVVGWAEVDRPVCCGQEIKLRGMLGCLCCGQEIKLRGMLGCLDKAWCEVCGKFIWRVLGPEIEGSTMSFPDIPALDYDDPKQWVSGDRVGALPRL
jgi:hypothetical protein